MKRYQCGLKLCLAGALVVGGGNLQSVHANKLGVANKAIKETVEFLAKKAGRESSEQFLKVTTAQLDGLVATYGNDVLDVVQKHGFPAFRVLQRANGDAGPYLVAAIKTYGDDGIRVARSAAGRAVLKEGNEQAIRAVARYTDAAVPFLRKYGDEGAEALAKLSPVSGRRLLQLGNDTVLSNKQKRDLLPVIKKYGDEAMAFIWRHKKALAVTAVLATFLNDPNAYINGAKTLGRSAIDAAKTLGVAAIENAGKPLNALAEEASKSIKWNLWMGVIIIGGGMLFYFKHHLKFSRRGNKTEELT
jgi:hypothetical protein